MASQEDLQDDKDDDVREEFRQVFLPLMRMTKLDKPKDVIFYCATYFQNLLEERERSCVSGNENEQRDFEGADDKALGRESSPQLQGSTSLPAFTSTQCNKLPIRETSSWNNPPTSKCSSSRRVRFLSSDVADAMSSIGDQPSKNVPEDCQNVGNHNAKGPGDQLFFVDEIEKKHNENCKINAETESLLISDYEAPPIDTTAEERHTAIVNLVSSSDIPPQTTRRKKWSTNVDSNSPIALKVQLPVDEEEEVTLDINCTNDKEIEAKCPPFNNSFESIPQLKELANFAHEKKIYTPSTQKEVENSAKLVSRSLNELAKVLNAVKHICDENLQKVKALSETLPTKSQAPLRKKRSVTTFSTSDDLIQNKEALIAYRKPPNSSGKGCNKTSHKVSDLKNNDCKVELYSLGSDHPLKGKRVNEECSIIKKISSDEEYKTGIRNNLNTRKKTDINEGRNHRDSVESKGTDLNDAFSKDKPHCKDGFVNKGFVMDDDNISHKKGNRHGQQQCYGQIDPRQTMLKEARLFFQNNPLRPQLRRNANPTRHFPHTRRQISWYLPDSGVSNIDEGGDVFRANLQQRSVATETEATNTTERKSSFDEMVKAIRIKPIANGNSETYASSSETAKDKSDSQESETELRSHKTSVEELSVGSGVSADGSSGLIGEKRVKKQIIIDVKPSKKSSSLNPCAESFNPTSKLAQHIEDGKSLDKTETTNLRKRRHSSDKDPTEETIVNFPQLDDEEIWDYEIFDNDLQLQDREPILYQDIDSEENEMPLILEDVEPNQDLQNGVKDSDLVGPINVSSQINGIQNDKDGLESHSPEKNLHNMKGEIKKHKSRSETKLAEGDQNSEDDDEQAEKKDSSEKQAMRLDSACGDFVISENNNGDELSSSEELDSDKALASSDAIAFGSGIFGLMPLTEDNIDEQRKKEDEEMELNFSCFSGSESSEVDSSDISEDGNEFTDNNK